MWTIIAILLILWLIALLSSVTLGGLVHLLPIAAVLVLIVGAFQRRRV